jgi:hypothetical protein
MVLKLGEKGPDSIMLSVLTLGKEGLLLESGSQLLQVATKGLFINYVRRKG